MVALDTLTTFNQLLQTKISIFTFFYMANKQINSYGKTFGKDST